MDKKNTTIGVLLLIAALAFGYFGQQNQPASTPDAPQLAPQSAPMPGAENAAPGPAQRSLPKSSLADTSFDALVDNVADATVTTIGNDYIQLRLTDFGGAIRNVAMGKYTESRDSTAPYIFNELHAAPILALTEFPGLGRETRYTLVSSSRYEAVYQTVLEGRLEVTRTYRVLPTGATEGDPYQVFHETSIRNLADSLAPLPRAAMSIGTASLVSANDYGQYLNVASFNGEDTNYTDPKDLAGGGLLSMVGMAKSAPVPFIETPGPITWGAVKNQFFASIYTPETPALGVITRRIELPPIANSRRENIGVTGAIRLDIPAVAAGETVSLRGKLYVGPKEYTRLSKLGHEEDRVMQFDRYFFNRIAFSSIIAPLMNMLMVWTHGWIGNWGWAIVVMTLLLKIATLPFTLAASRSAKRMQKVQPRMKEIREKFKDNPKKLNEETMKVFKEAKVNPLGGCLPILVTMPLFVAFFAMLQGTAELRFQSFLWSPDLSAPDTVWHLASFPLNIMPLLMGATMLIQMNLTPTPSVDNAQAKMMKFMPLIFMAFCYNFATGLALYSTVNGLFSIIQQLVVNKMKDPEPAVATAAAAPVSGRRPNKSIKNVTPKKKKK